MKTKVKLHNDDRSCKVCGKIFTVLHPDRWAYKQTMGSGYNYFCSWKCLRAYEKQQEEKPAKKYVKKPEKKEAIGLATIKHRDQGEVIHGMLAAMEDGEDPRKWLQKIGYANPYDQLKRLKVWATKNDPKAAEALKKIPALKKGPAKGVKRGPRVIGRVVEKKETNGGLVVTVEKLPEEARPKPQAGGEWEKAPRMIGVNDDLARQAKAAEKLCVDIKEIMFPQPEWLQIAGLESRAIEKATYVKTGEMIVLMKGDDMNLALKKEQWKGLADEIGVMLGQFGT